MSKKTTVKTAMLGFRAVGGTGDYTKVAGVLKGLTIGQDEPDSTEIEAEFFDAPFDIVYDGNPVTFNFELANYDLAELPALFGGSYDAATDTYEGAANAHTTEYEWKLDFQRGNAALVLYRGLTIGTIKKDEDGALNYAVSITALNYTDENDVEHMYKIVASTSTPQSPYTFIDLGLPSGTKWADMNLGATAPEEAGLYYMWGDINGHAADEGYNFDWGDGWDSTNKQFDPEGNYGKTAAAGLFTDIPANATYDAARAAIGGSARMPTRGDMFELNTFCTSEWTTVNGVAGRRFTGPNGNSIFLPAAGQFDGTDLNAVGSIGYCWESTMSDVGSGCYLYFDDSNVNPDSSDSRVYGCSVRAVQK